VLAGARALTEFMGELMNSVAVPFVLPPSALGCDDTCLFGWQQQPKNKSDQQQGGYITQ
jgi:hypothetical protein